MTREEAIDVLKHNYPSACFTDLCEAVEIAIQALSAQPEIIRCKDCKYYEIWQLKADYTDDKRYKPSVCTIGKYSVHRSPDWYCADAERRTDGHERED